jgi:bacterioferritin
MDCFSGVARMKGQEQVINELNARLAEELTAINQYMVHAEIDDNWGYERLHKLIEKRAIVEMKHAEKLIARIIFLEGMPVVSQLNQINIGSDVEKQHRSDWASENDAIKNYNRSIKVATDLADNGTKELLESILKDEEDHIDEIEAQLDEIQQMGIQNYLSEQTGE